MLPWNLPSMAHHSRWIATAALLLALLAAASPSAAAAAAERFLVAYEPGAEQQVRLGCARLSMQEGTCC